MNSDDYYVEDTVLNQIGAFFEKKNTTIVLSGVQFFNNSKKRKLGREFKPSKSLISSSWHTPHPGFFYLRKSYPPSSYIFNETAKIAADVNFMVALVKKAGSSVVNSNLNSVMMEEGGISTRGVA